MYKDVKENQLKIKGDVSPEDRLLNAIFQGEKKRSQMDPLELLGALDQELKFFKDSYTDRISSQLEASDYDPTFFFYMQRIENIVSQFEIYFDAKKIYVKRDERT